MATRFFLSLRLQDVKRFYNDWKMTSAQYRSGIDFTAKKNKGVEDGLLVVIEAHNKEAREFVRHSLFGTEGALTTRGWRAKEAPAQLT